MSEKKFKYSRLVSPKGMFKYAWINKPDAGFDGKAPAYKTRFLMEDNEESRAFVEKVMDLAKKEAKEAGVKLKKKMHSPFNLPEDADEDDFVPEEGKDKPKLDEDYKDAIWFACKSNYKPSAIDSARESLPENVFIMSGDTGKVKVELFAYEGLGSGVTLRLVTAQLLEKNTTFSGGKGDTEGFGDEDGYTVEQNHGDDEEEF